MLGLFYALVMSKSAMEKTLHDPGVETRRFVELPDEQKDAMYLYASILTHNTIQDMYNICDKMQTHII